MPLMNSSLMQIRFLYLRVLSTELKAMHLKIYEWKLTKSKKLHIKPELEVKNFPLSFQIV